MDTLCEQNAELLIVKAGGLHSYHWALKCQTAYYLMPWVHKSVHARFKLDYPHMIV
jgi:hypothetical protein